ncbi:hypothetical protein BC834DRAFT_973673 [Gloeopeniophorella convolvens]|nr:hypothetical protein BC834DRAFT_973673 [Gloeopeniophorella convolvens]
MPSLSQHAGLKLAPLFVQTLLKHYYGNSRVALRDEDLLYDQVFYIVKQLIQVATEHTVEELQSFSQSRSLSAPWSNVVRTHIPLPYCDTAATHLIDAFGGEEVMQRVVGGTKWWQVRSTPGVEAEWVIPKKEKEKPQRRGKEPQETRDAHRAASPEDSSSEEGDREPSSGTYEPEMDDTPCLLYIHGGGYYFGSIDGGRSALERYARKFQGRVFAVGYRLAPQYPFPCAIQDVLAAYLYLIRPPAGASHKPVNPNNIVIGGDSSGAGLSLALLQVIRDSGLPLPAGGVLISPWCDLTHSFPSIITNTATDVLPETGLSLHKPSGLWPPPSGEMTARVHEQLRMAASSVMETFDGSTRPTQPELCGTSEHEKDEQFQFYTENRLLRHPLVTPALAYLGGLPPLFFIAGDGEVLRDEIIYTQVLFWECAHRAAHPEQFPLDEDVKKLYPRFQGIESRMQPTAVHLQVYDDAAHILPTLFPFTSPAKYCYRAIGTFIKHVTNAPPRPKLPRFIPAHIEIPVSDAFGSSFLFLDDSSPDSSPASSPVRPLPLRPLRWGASGLDDATAPERPSLESKRSFVATLSHAAMKFGSKRNRAFHLGVEGAETEPVSSHSRGSSLDSRSFSLESALESSENLLAGNSIVYHRWEKSKNSEAMIRERISTQGVIRPLEHEHDLQAFTVPAHLIGHIPERVLSRYFSAKTLADQKHASAHRAVAKQRERTLSRAARELSGRAGALRAFLAGDGDAEEGNVRRGLLAASRSWSLAWALGAAERPPPSSVAARLDTDEALRAARAADQTVLEVRAGAAAPSASRGNLWGAAVGVLAVARLRAALEERKALPRSSVRAPARAAEEAAEGEMVLVIG